MRSPRRSRRFGRLRLLRLIASLYRHQQHHRRSAGDLAGTLTPRERQVLALIAQGASNRAIADALVIAECTAEIHVSNILGKLGVTSRTQAATYAVAHGLAAPPSA